MWIYILCINITPIIRQVHQVTAEAFNPGTNVYTHSKSQFGKYHVMKQRFTVKIDQYTNVYIRDKFLHIF